MKHLVAVLALALAGCGGGGASPTPQSVAQNLSAPAAQTQATNAPTSAPSLAPTSAPTSAPTPSPSATPSATPTATAAPTSAPTVQPTPTPYPTPLQTATPIAPVVLSAYSLTLAANGPSQSVTVSEQGYAQAFTISTLPPSIAGSCTLQVQGGIEQVIAVASQATGSVFTVTGLHAGTCAFTISGAEQVSGLPLTAMSATLSVTVTP